MKYELTYFKRGVEPSREFFNSKGEAVENMRLDVRDETARHKGTGFKKEGSISSGYVRFHCVGRGTECVIKIEKVNN